MRFAKRIVFDTSTLISAALLSNSVPRKALVAALANADLCGSQTTLLELDQVMMRAKFDRYLNRTARREFLALVKHHTHLFPVTENDEANLPQSCRDPKDNKFLALALACEADVVVSSDDDLKAPTPYQGVAILSPREFLS